MLIGFIFVRSTIMARFSVLILATMMLSFTRGVAESDEHNSLVQFSTTDIVDDMKKEALDNIATYPFIKDKAAWQGWKARQLVRDSINRMDEKDYGDKKAIILSAKLPSSIGSAQDVAKVAVKEGLQTMNQKTGINLEGKTEQIAYWGSKAADYFIQHGFVNPNTYTSQGAAEAAAKIYTVLKEQGGLRTYVSTFPTASYRDIKLAIRILGITPDFLQIHKELIKKIVKDMVGEYGQKLVDKAEQDYQVKLQRARVYVDSDPEKVEIDLNVFYKQSELLGSVAPKGSKALAGCVGSICPENFVKNKIISQLEPAIKDFFYQNGVVGTFSFDKTVTSTEKGVKGIGINLQITGLIEEPFVTTNIEALISGVSDEMNNQIDKTRKALNIKSMSTLIATPCLEGGMRCLPNAHTVPTPVHCPACTN
jgi:hypothetical protein